MKKILLILLAFTSFASFAQAEFPEGIALSGNASSTNATKVVIQEPTTGNLNYINALDLPASTADKLKGFLSTGLLKNGAIAINVDPTKFNITAGIGIISNFDDPENPVSTIINFPAFTGITPTYLTTGNITYIAINSTPAVVMQATPFTAIQRRDLIELGAVIHSNLTTINVVNNISSPTNAGTNQIHDLFDFIGALNLSGNVYFANGANLQLNKSAGIIGKRGVNFINNWKDPHRLPQGQETALSFRYRTQNGTEGSDRINLDPALYDLNNVLTAVPNNKFTIQTVVMFQTGLTRILYGQTIYDDLQTAVNAVLTRSFVIEPNSKENGIIRAYVIMKNTTTSLQNVADAKILEAQKFGGVASGGVALTLANILTALGYTPANDLDALHITGDETKTGILSFINSGASLINGLNLVNNGSTGSYSFYNNNTSTGVGSYSTNQSTGVNYQINSATASTGDLIQFLKNNIIVGKITHSGTGIFPLLSVNNLSSSEFNLSISSDRTGVFYADASQVILNAVKNVPLIFRTNDTERGSFSNLGVFKLNNLAGIGARTVVADASGNLSATEQFFTGSSSLNFPSTPAGQSNELSFSVSGASDGDLVILGIPSVSENANSCYTARVSSSNTVAVKFNNYSALAIDPAVGTFKVKVLK